MPVTVPVTPSRFERRAVAPPDLVWRLNVDQYHAMIDAGILNEDDPIELLNGCLVPKMPKNPPHCLSTGLIREALARLLPTGWFVDAQEPITTADSEPEPDLRVVRGQRRDYLRRHPGAGDLALIVEVSDATLERDRTLKQQLYARAGIPVYWIANLRAQQIEVYTEPSAEGEPGYRQRRELAPGETVALVLDGVEVGRLEVRDLLP